MHLIELWLNPLRLVQFAQAQGHNRDGDEDLGYALHAWLRATFGAPAPSCYRSFVTKGNELRLLAYCSASADALT